MDKRSNIVSELEKHLSLKNSYINKKERFYGSFLGKINKYFHKNQGMAFIYSFALTLVACIIFNILSIPNAFLSVVFLFSMMAIMAISNIGNGYLSPTKKFESEIVKKMFEISNEYPSMNDTIKKYIKMFDCNIPKGWWVETFNILNKIKTNDGFTIKKMKINILDSDIEKTEIKMKKYERIDLI